MRRVVPPLSHLALLCLLALTGCKAGGACVTQNTASGSGSFHCSDTSKKSCQDSFCFAEDTYCGFYPDYDCEELGMADGPATVFDPLLDPEWSTGSYNPAAGNGACGSSYQGPYRCNAGNDYAADQNCLVYDSLEATEPCPYCP